MMASGRVIHAGLRLLDRQLVDRSGRLCGKVDDLELEAAEDGTLYVSAVLSGPGALLQRTGHTALGGWLRRHLPAVLPEGTDDGRIPIAHVADIGNHITLSLDAEQVAGFAAERWVRDHIISHLPGSGARAGR